MVQHSQGPSTAVSEPTLKKRSQTIRNNQFNPQHWGGEPINTTIKESPSYATINVQEQHKTSGYSELLKNDMQNNGLQCTLLHIANFDSKGIGLQ